MDEFEKYMDPYTIAQRFDRGGKLDKVWFADAMNSGGETLGRNRFYNIDQGDHQYWEADYKYYKKPESDWLYI